MIEADLQERPGRRWGLGGSLGQREGGAWEPGVHCFYFFRSNVKKTQKCSCVHPSGDLSSFSSRHTELHTFFCKQRKQAFLLFDNHSHPWHSQTAVDVNSPSSQGLKTQLRASLVPAFSLISCIVFRASCSIVVLLCAEHWHILFLYFS